MAGRDAGKRRASAPADRGPRARASSSRRRVGSAIARKTASSRLNRVTILLHYRAHEKRVKEADDHFSRLTSWSLPGRRSY